MSVRRSFKSACARLNNSSALAAVIEFRSREDGVMAKTAVGFLFAMLAVGGIGVDLMRMERDRTVLQYTLDRAVLAAADLDQPLSPPIVVQDYLNKSGMSEYYETPLYNSGIGFKNVESSIEATFQSHMLKFAGGGDMEIHARSRAEESIDGLEISLVLDVSGSMNSNSRIRNLRTAAKEFVDTMIANTAEGKMSISIVPYATQVSLPEELVEQYNVDRPQEHANCVNFDGSDFSTTAISTTAQLQGAMLFDPWYRYDTRSSGYPMSHPNGPRSYTVCEPDAAREIKPFSNDADDLKTYIDNLQAWGNTSIDLGMKWGTALLDPSARPAISALSSGDNAIISSDFSARPADFTDSDSTKVIVLMTDGQNTSQYYVRDNYRDGLTTVYYNPQENVYSTYDATYDRYYWHNYGRWEDHPYGADPGNVFCLYNYYNCPSEYRRTEQGSIEQLTYGELYAFKSVRSVYEMFRDWMGQNSARYHWYNYVFSYHGNSTKNTRTRAICQAAKEQGIAVYTIAFEAPSDGTALLQDCASSDAHFFDVQGLEISDAFKAIATSIRSLRLTQ